MAEPVGTAEVIDRIAQIRERKNGTVLVAIDGPGGAGKTVLARTIAAALPDVTVVGLDDFARPSVPGWDMERFVRDVLDPILADRPGRYQRWEWSTDRPAEWHDVAVGGVVVVEGVSSTRHELGEPWDLTVWVSTPYETRLDRGVARDGEGMRSRWTDVWMPGEDAYIALQRRDERADLVVDGTASN